MLFYTSSDPMLALEVNPILVYNIRVPACYFSDSCVNLHPFVYKTRASLWKYYATANRIPGIFRS